MQIYKYIENACAYDDSGIPEFSKGEEAIETGIIQFVVFQS